MARRPSCLGCPPRLVRTSLGPGPGCAGGSRAGAGARRRDAGVLPRDAAARAEAAAANSQRGGERECGGRRAGPGWAPASDPSGPEDCSALGNLSGGRRGRLGRRQWALREERPCHLPRLLLTRAPFFRLPPPSWKGGDTGVRLRRFLPEVGVRCLALLARRPEGEPFNFSRTGSSSSPSRAGWAGRGSVGRAPPLARGGGSWRRAGAPNPLRAVSGLGTGKIRF